MGIVDKVDIGSMLSRLSTWSNLPPGLGPLFALTAGSGWHRKAVDTRDSKTLP